MFRVGSILSPLQVGNREVIRLFHFMSGLFNIAEDKPPTFETFSKFELTGAAIHLRT